MPKRVMRRYVHRGKRRGAPLRGSKINFGEYGLQAMEAGWITSNQIESASYCYHAVCPPRWKALD